MQLAAGIIMLVASVFLIIAVLMQSGKSHNLSGAIAGGAETFFGKTKGKALDKKLSRLTTIVAIVFVVLVVIVYVIQPDYDLNDIIDAQTSAADTTAEETVDSADTTAEAVDSVADTAEAETAEAETAAETTTAEG
jgi:preprotein translocase subunit SecG